MKKSIATATLALLAVATPVMADSYIGKNDIKLTDNLMTPEALWAMGRIGGVEASPNGKQMVYSVAYYSVEHNKGHRVLYVSNTDGSNKKQLTTTADSESDAVWIDEGKRIAFLRGGQVWSMNADGSDRRQLTKDKSDIEGFKFSPNEKYIILVKRVKFNNVIRENPGDLPLATGMVIDDLMYRHWDHYVKDIPHPFLAEVTSSGITEGMDILEGEPYECPMEPFGGIEQLDWNPNSQQIAYTCRKKVGKAYSISTDSDIFLYDISTKKTTNLCKPLGYIALQVDATKSLKNQKVNNQGEDYQVGYDVNPKFSPDGRYIAWQSMRRDGYEADRNRLFVRSLADDKVRLYVTESFDSNVDDYVWSLNSKNLYFIGVWHGCVNMYQTDLQGNVMQLTDDRSDFGSLALLGNTGKIIAKRHSMSAPDDIYIVTLSKKEKKSEVKQITFENKHILDQLSLGKVQQRWVITTDGKKELVWIILPSNFDETKKYPTLLFCEGGPQSPVSQFWSYRWNFQIMAANGYVIIAPNRRGLPGFGSEWNEQISGDWTGQCMKDYLSAIDDAVENLPFVDKERLGAVGASFGGFSVYYLAGHHEGRFKAFISHDGAFNLEGMYMETEENWFSNWEYDDAYWNKDKTEDAKRTYDHSPHRFVDKWDTPILCIHGEKDYRINATQGMAAFNAARMKGVDAQLLLYPDENHWVLKPQNGILWQRTFFAWLDKYLKK